MANERGMKEAVPDSSLEAHSAEELANRHEVTLDLIRRCQAGDVQAIGEVIDRYYARLVRIVRLNMFASIRNKCEPEEVVNSAFSVALKNFPKFEHREDASVLNWLSTLAYNKMREKARYFDAECRRASLEVCIDAFGGGRDESTPHFEIAAKDSHPPEKAAREEYRVLVDELVSQLPVDYQSVIRYRDYERGSWDYVASQMGRSTGAVLMLHKRARKLLLEHPEMKTSP